MTPHSPLVIQNWKSHAKITRYDTAKSWLVAIVVMVGCLTAMLFLLWLTTVWSHRPVSPVIGSFAINLPATATTGGQPGAIEEPSVGELVEVLEPELEVTLTSMSSVVAAVSGDIHAMDAASEHIAGCIGVGDHRKTGAGEPGFWERWDIRYSVDDIDEYAAQLDHFQIELGVVGGGKLGIDYAKNLSAAHPQARSIVDASLEHRFFFNFEQPDMQRLDAALLGRAGVKTEGRFPIQFYPDEVIKQLLTLEYQALNGRDAKEINQTVFGVRGSTDDYEFYVAGQSYTK